MSYFYSQDFHLYLLPFKRHRGKASVIMEPMTISIAAARDALGLGTTTIYGLISDGRLDTVKVGRRRLVTVASIKRLIGKGG